MYKRSNKILASIIVFIMILANLSPIGAQIGKVIAADVELNNQNSKTNNENVMFDTYFVDNSRSSHDVIKNIGEENKIIAEVSVINGGYLKDARIDFIDSNFTLQNITTEKVSKVENNSVMLNQINSDEDSLIEIPFKFEHGEKVNLNQLNKISTAVLTGTYVDDNGKTHNIKKDINLGLKWTANVEVSIESEVTKYIPYTVGEQKGLILQMLVKENVKDNVLPVKENKTEIEVPQINNVKPTKITVFSHKNIEYAFDEKTQKLTIVEKNDANEQNEVNWNEMSTSKYEVTIVYPETAITEAVKINSNITSNVKVYSYNEQELNIKYNNEFTLSEKLGDIVDTKVQSTEMLSKGYMYANYNKEQKIETTFSEKVTTNISLPELVDEITINIGKDNFINETEIGIANSYYKNIKLSKSKVIEFFGEEGSLSIFNSQGLIAKIDKETENDEITIELNSDEIAIVTSKPVKAGEFTLEFNKAIKGEEIYTEEQISKFAFVQSQVNLQANNSQAVVTQKAVETKVALVEPLLQAELYVSNTNLSTVVTNQDVQLRAVLKTNSEYNKLFNNPVIAINLPEYIETINVKDVQVLFDDELKVKTCNIVGKQIIIELEGVQTNYNIGSIYGGTNIVILADLKVNNLTPNREDVVTMVAISGEEQLTSNVKVNFIAPSGVVAVNKISGYVEGQELMALTNDESAVLEAHSTAKVATEELQVINNYNNKIENVKILGRTLSIDTTNPTTAQSLNNNLNVPMLGAIRPSAGEDATIYYSNNGSASQDLNNSTNGWTTDVADFSQVKSYLIVLNNNSAMNVGDSVKFSYDMQIPEDLSYSKASSSLYTVFFDNVQEEQTLIGDNVTSRIATIGTGNAPDLQVTLTSNMQENSIVRTGQYIRYIATVKNTSTTVDAENTKLKITAPSMEGVFTTKHTVYKEENYFTGYENMDEPERTIEVGNIKAGEQAEIEFEIVVVNTIGLEYTSYEDEDTGETGYENPSYGTEIDLNIVARAIADKMQKEENSNEYKLKLQAGDIELVLVRNPATSTLYNGRELEYSLKISKTSQNALNNLVATIQIPKGLTIKETSIKDILGEELDITKNIEIDSKNNIVKFTLQTMPDENIYCNVLTEVGDIEGKISSIAVVTVGEKTYYSNNVENIVEKLNFTIVQNKPETLYVKEGKKITFEYVITNNSNVYCEDFTFENIVPDGIKEISIDINDSGSIKQEQENGKVKINRTVHAKQTLNIKVTLEADILPEGQTQKTFINYATIYGKGFETKESNKINATIEYNEDIYKEDDNDNPNPVGKIISGVAWIDKNQDGERNENEELITGMEVRLLNKSTNEVIKTTTTSSTGEYTFLDLEKGEYLVVFLYNSAKYELTKYKKDGVSGSVNSDVINVQMDIDGQNRTVAISNTIKITDSNARNIDIGLCDSNKSDMKLDKYISAVTVSYGSTVKTYNYDKSKLAKVEIPANSLSGATVIVEYKIVVTNEGAIGNYVKKLVDYIPSGMKFNSELNRDWYQSTNGDIYNSSLANIKIESGESKEVTLTLTKQMTNDNTGIVNNNAELYEVYNEEGILDKDSTHGNKINNEDDMSAADLVISVKTGDAVIYTLIISTIIVIALGIGIYFIRKTLLKKI